MGHYVEDPYDFELRHGKPVKVGGTLIYPDGATCDAFNANARQEPPAEDYRRWTLQRNHWAERLSRVTADFNALRNALKGMGPRFRWQPAVYGESHGSGPADLAYLGRIVKSYREKVAKFEEAIDQTPQMVERRRQAAIQQEIANGQMLAGLEDANEADAIAADLGIA